MSDSSVAPPSVRPDLGRTVLVGATSALVALVANLAVLVIAVLTDTEMLVRPGADREPMQIGVVLVVVTTVLPLFVGTVLLLLARRWRLRGWLTLAVAGLVIGFISVVMPFSVPAEIGTRLALGLMHIITGVTWYVVVRRAAAQLWAA